MSYHIYTTDGIVLKQRGVGEGNVLLHILTRDLGLIMASVQAAKLPHSKLKGALQEYSFSSVSAVKGKNGWKVTNALAMDNFYFSLPEHTRRTLAQVSSAILLLSPGEAPHREIFDIVRSGFAHLSVVPDYDLFFFECLLMLRVLYHLGYVVSDGRTEVFLNSDTEWNDGILKEVAVGKKEIVSIINKGLSASQLA